MQEFDGKGNSGGELLRGDAGKIIPFRVHFVFLVPPKINFVRFRIWPPFWSSKMPPRLRTTNNMELK